jgi:large subunit ribosomal protein L3
MNFLLGKKLNMTQYFDEASGEVVPVTVIKAGVMTVTQVKTAEGKDKYSAVQVGIDPLRQRSEASKKSRGAGSQAEPDHAMSGGRTSAGKKASKSLQGHLKGIGAFGVLSEFRVTDDSKFSRGQKVEITGFSPGEMVNVIGVSKGRGFAGAMKRHGFKGFPMSHGHNKPRSVGSIGQRFPQHVRKGMRMSGHMGVEQVTVKNLQIVEVDANKNLITVKGAVPGHRNGLVKIISTGKVKPLVKVVFVKEEKKKK